MQRRQFIKGIVVLPVLGACTSYVGYDGSKYGALQRVGLVRYPHQLSWVGGFNLNMYAAAGERAAYAERISKALGNRVDQFASTVLATIAAVLNERGIGTSEVPGEIGRINPIYTSPARRTATEPVFLECRTALTFAKTSNGIIPGASSFSKLGTPDGKLLWRLTLAIGPSFFPKATLLAVPDVRFQGMEEIADRPDYAAGVLMGLASPLGKANALILIGDTSSGAGAESKGLQQS